MPEDAASVLERTDGLCERYLPRLRQRTKWAEKKWTVIVVGVGRERVIEASVSEPEPLVKGISPGTCALGYELHHALGETGSKEPINGSNRSRIERRSEKGALEVHSLSSMMGCMAYLITVPSRSAPVKSAPSV